MIETRSDKAHVNLVLSAVRSLFQYPTLMFVSSKPKINLRRTSPEPDCAQFVIPAASQEIGSQEVPQGLGKALFTR